MDGNSDQLPAGYKYWVFLSYSHADNRTPHRMWANWLHESLETYRLPETLAGSEGGMGFTVPERIYPVFQDEKELPTRSDLGSALEAALEESVFLVVLCSPRSAKSLWVNQEILHFKQMGRESRILPLIIDGEPNASEPGKEHLDPDLECFPETLRYKIGPDGLLDKTRRTEPIAADIRLDDGGQASLDLPEHAPILDREKLRIIAGVAGVGFDQLIQRDRQRELLRLMQEKAAREAEALSLFSQAEEAVAKLAKEAPLHGQDFVFKQLGEAEDFLVRAGQKNPDLGQVGERLAEVRTMLVETGIESGDLNMATLFLARLRSVAGKEKESQKLKERLDALLLASDPRLHPGLKLAENLAVGAILAGLVWPWLFALVYHQAFAGSGTGPKGSLAQPILFLMHVPVAIAVASLRMIGRARTGEEVGHRRALLGAYFAAVTGAFTLNLPILACFVKIVRLLGSDDVVKLSWRIRATQK